MKLFILNLRKKLAKESLARMRKRIKLNLINEHNRLIYNSVFNSGKNGYLRDRNCYGK